MGMLLESTVDFLKKYGYLKDSENPQSFEDIELKAAIQKYQRFEPMVNENAKEIYGRDVDPDGVLGYATAQAMAAPRCACHDLVDGQPLEALGRAGWRNCHGFDDIHSTIIEWDTGSVPSYWSAEFKNILSDVQKYNAEIGWFMRFRNKDGTDILTGKRIEGTANITSRFRSLGGSTIGLATVGNSRNQQCSDSSMFADFDPKFSPSNVRVNGARLIQHEYGHSMSMGHSDGIMRASFKSGDSARWIGDYSEDQVKSLFSGVPIPISAPKPDPEPPTGGDWPKIGEPIGESFLIAPGVRAQLTRVFGG